MIPNNNLSVLPWYASIEEQNARRWWVYKRVYPLFTPAGFLLPFQLMREHRGPKIEPVGDALERTGRETPAVLSPLGGWVTGAGTVSFYNTLNMAAVYFDKLPRTTSGYVSAQAYNSANTLLDTLIVEFTEDFFSGGWELPTGTAYIYVQTGSPTGDMYEENGGVYDAEVSIYDIESFAIYTKDNVLVGNYNPSEMGFSIVEYPERGFDVIVFPGQLPVLGNFENGQYYAVMSDGTETWYSEVFTVVNDISPYLKLEWWDAENFVMDAGTIVYKNPNFKNVLYLDATIAKPDYRFEEEGEERDGYFFPTKQISEKRYKFAFFASEYLLDVMRLVRMADFAQITKNGQVYSLDTFLITPEWESNGDVASVTAEFDTATVAKKIGTGYIKALRGDFNDDFNNDFDI